MTHGQAAEESFGVVIACSRHDVHLARGACASVRYFMGDGPICLIVDGRPSVSDLVSTYGVRVVRIRDVEHDGLRERSFGYGLTKMVALWEAPFETFLYLDADAVLWGDITEPIDLGGLDFVIDDRGSDWLDWGELWRRRVPQIEEAFPGFDWARHTRRFANTGVFFARRGALDVDEYLELVRLQRSTALGRKSGFGLDSEQGILNFMLFRAADAQLIRLRLARLQVRASLPHTGFDGRFEIVDGRPHVSEPRVLHWVGPRKVTIASPAAVAAPSTFFREQFGRARLGGRSPLVPVRVRLRSEDLLFELRRRRRESAARVRRSLEFRRRAGVRGALRWPSLLTPKKPARRDA